MELDLKSCFFYEELLLAYMWTNLSSDFNHMLLGVFVVVMEAQKLEVCSHKQNCMIEKLSEKLSD